MTTKPTKIYLKDYQAPSYGVHTVNLDIKLYDDHATVNTNMTMFRQGEGDLILLGRDLELKSISKPFIIASVKFI